jgi:hypothetical protein
MLRPSDIGQQIAHRSVTPAKAGGPCLPWIPAFAGMTMSVGVLVEFGFSL